MRSVVSVLAMVAFVAANLATFDPATLLDVARSGEALHAIAAEIASAENDSDAVVVETHEPITLDSVAKAVGDQIDQLSPTRLTTVASVIAALLLFGYIGRLCIAARRRASISVTVAVPIDLSLQRKLLRAHSSPAHQ